MEQSGVPPGEVEQGKAGLAIQLLGGFRLWRDGRELSGPWRTEKARTLVKLLALTMGYVLHRDQVIEWLWPETDPEAAANNLYFVIHAARRVLDGGATGALATCLVFRDGLLRLVPQGGLTTDVAAF